MSSLFLLDSAYMKLLMEDTWICFLYSTPKRIYFMYSTKEKDMLLYALNEVWVVAISTFMCAISPPEKLRVFLVSGGDVSLDVFF